MDHEWIDMLIMAFYAGMLDVYEIVTMMMILVFCTPETEHENLRRLNVDELTEEKCWIAFRFQKQHLHRLQRALRIPDVCVFMNGITETGLNSLCIFLRRLCYPNRLDDLIPFLGRRRPDLSIIFHGVLEHISQNFFYLITDLNAPYWLAPNFLQTYANAVFAKGAPLHFVWGFIDGTGRPCCRPGMYQNVLFSGHKRIHCLKFQSIMTANGIICNMFGPVEGRRHDSFMLRESGILPILERSMNDANGHPFAVYGDPAYPLRPHLMCPYKGANLTPAQEDFNAEMSKLRQCVEWGFGDIVTNFAFVDFRKNLKIFLQPIGKIYLAATLMTNCRACLYGNQTSVYFGVNPPSLEQYLNNHP